MRLKEIFFVFIIIIQFILVSESIPIRSILDSINQGTKNIIQSSKEKGYRVHTKAKPKKESEKKPEESESSFKFQGTKDGEYLMVFASLLGIFYFLTLLTWLIPMPRKRRNGNNNRVTRISASTISGVDNV